MNTRQTRVSSVQRRATCSRHNSFSYFYNIYACKNIGYICLHFAEQKIRQCAFVSLCSEQSCEELSEVSVSEVIE